MNKSIILLTTSLLLLSSGCSSSQSTTSTSSTISSSSSGITSSVSITTTSSEPQIEYKSLDVVTFQPFFSHIEGGESSVPEWKLPEGYTNYNQLLEGAANELSNKVSSISFDKQKNCSKDEVLTSTLFEKLGKNQIILFEGHGSFEKFYDDDPEMHSVMWTGKKYDESKKDTDPDYLDYNLVPAGYLGYEEALTVNFIEKYVGDLTGSIVYLGNCFSLRETTFADMFIQKGAEAVIGNTLTTQATYNSLMTFKTITTLAEINPQTNKTYTLFEAMELAKTQYGQTDKDKYPVSYGSRPTIFGNPNFTISEKNK